MTPAANLPTASLIFVANWTAVSTKPAVPVAKFATCVIDTGGAPSLANMYANFRNDPNVLFEGLGEDS